MDEPNRNRYNLAEVEVLIENLDKYLIILKQIKNIMKSSIFNLSILNNKELYLQFIGSFIIDDEKEILRRDINFETLIGLREKVLLTKNPINKKEINELNKIFKERVNEIESIFDLLKKISENGYSEDIEISVEIKGGNPTFYSDEINFKDFDECKEYLSNILSKTIELQKNYYKNKNTPLIRYIYGRQFNLLNGFLKNLSNESLSAFLRFLTNDKIKSDVDLENIKYNYDYDLIKEDKYACLLENINKFLNGFLIQNDLTLEFIYKQNILNNKFKNDFKGLYTYLLKDDKGIQNGVEEHILKLYHFLTGNTPMAQNVLLCNEETTYEEIIAFLYRAIMCEYHVVFMVGKIELLGLEKMMTLQSVFNSLFIGHEEEIESCLVFVYSDKTSIIAQNLEKIKRKKILQLKDIDNNEEIKYGENVEIITSDKSGVGKSTIIKQKIYKRGKKYIYFPLSGEFNRKDIINRLKLINIKNPQTTAIHLDLNDSKKIDLMEDFLFRLLITKLYGQNGTLFYLPKDVEIKIEIPNGFFDFFLKFPILGMFKNIDKLSIEKLPPLIVPVQINSNLQIVCNYLKLLKSGKIAEQDLYIKNVSLEGIQDMLDPEYIQNYQKTDGISLSSKECEDLIKEYIGLKLPSYYQINCFINALSGQLKKFSLDFQLLAGNLIQSENMLGRPNLRDIRVTMIKGLIKNTLFFTQSAFNKLLNSQLDNYKVCVEQGNYNEDKQDEIAIKALCDNLEIISFDKIKPSLIFFHEGGTELFSIISSCNKNEKEYKDLLELKTIPVIIENEFYKSNGMTKREEIPKELNNYNKFTHKMLLKEIKEILGLNNPVFNSEKNEENKNLKSIEEIVGEYVFDSNNFIKMVLINLHIRENIPIIIMGGVDKKNLIVNLSKLINNDENKMEFLNIHEGITDQKIIEFLFKDKKDGKNYIPNIIKRAEKIESEEEEKRKLYEKRGLVYNKKKLWIFLDEINTCNCMGLISEIMLKHSCQGIPLPLNIVFISGCQPYRIGIKADDLNELKIKGVKEKKSVSKLKPLPHSLLNFVFYFGN